MLFDLRGRGRRNAIKVIYAFLALLLGGGLILFGIGGGSSVPGGLVDAITGGSSGGDTGTSRFVARERQAAAATRANPRDQDAWVTLARARFSLAGIGENFDPSRSVYTAKGKKKLEGASQAWEHYLTLNPPDAKAAQLARVMVQTYAPEGLDQPAKAASAQEIVASARPGSNTYAQLAVYAYAAGQKRKGDLAKAKALELAAPDDRETLKSQLQQAETASTKAAAGSGAAAGG
jgi:hypothetical protein